MMQNLFPTLNVATARLATFRRVVLLHQLPESEGGCAQLRQYVIKAAPTGVSRGVKKLVRATRLPSLGRYESISDFLTGAGGMSSDSGGETDEEDKADLPQVCVICDAPCGTLPWLAHACRRTSNHSLAHIPRPPS